MSWRSVRYELLTPSPRAKPVAFIIHFAFAVTTMSAIALMLIRMCYSCIADIQRLFVKPELEVVMEYDGANHASLNIFSCWSDSQ